MKRGKKRILKKREVGKRINWKLLIASIIIVYSVAFIGSLFTGNNTKSDWYELIKPKITPPNYVFPIVWNILFFLIALSLYLVWENANKKEKRIVIWTYGINFILNIFWSFLYFYMKHPTFALVEIIFLEISIGAMIFVSYRINKKAAYLLVPYFIWVAFAMVLNYISVINLSKLISF